MNAKLIFNSKQCEVYKLVGCGRVEYRIYHKGNRVIYSKLEDVTLYLKNNI